MLFVDHILAKLGIIIVIDVIGESKMKLSLLFTS